MAKSFTLTCPKSLLNKSIPDFDVMGTDAQWVKSKVKSMIEDFLSSDDFSKMKELPDVEDDGDNTRMLISFGGVSEMALSTASQRYELTLSETSRRILGVIAINEPKVESHPEGAEEFLDIIKAAGYSDVRPEQVSFYLQNKATMDNGKIGLSEASTGTGKTLSMLVCAAQKAVETKSRVLIAVPTISLIHQFRQSYESAIHGFPSVMESIELKLGEAPTLRTIFGRREFVSEFNVQTLMVSGELDEKQMHDAQEWINYTKVNKTDINAWLIPTLESFVGDLDEFPVNEVRLGELVNKNDKGFIAYKLQMIAMKSSESEIMVATHAMLGIDFRARLFAARKDEEYSEISDILKSSFDEFFVVRKEEDADSAKKAADILDETKYYETERARALVRISENSGTIPHYRYLMVDECHQFESSLSNILSNYVSIRQLGRELKSLSEAGGKVSKAAIKEVNMAISDILSSSPSGATESKSDEVVMLNVNRDGYSYSGILQGIAKIVLVIDGLKAPPATSSDDIKLMYTQLKKDAAALRPLTKGGFGIVNYSPVRKFPQISIGRASMTAFLKQLWSFVEAASCVSATIHLPKGDGFTSWYMKSVLAIPESREAEYKPSIGPWIFRPITKVWQPETLHDVARLTPPKFNNGASEKTTEIELLEWHTSVASVILSEVMPNSEGGILMLCTSYKTCQEIGRQILENNKYWAVIIADQKVKVGVQKRLFLDARKQNKPTIWLATGGAWTGLDVSGKDIGLPAEQDNVITDLVIPRLPFKTNKSITHKHRQETRPSISWDVFETCFALRQGLGRLIRRPGLPNNRKIWMLDGRVVSNGKGRLAIFQKVLDKYKRK